MFGVPLAVFAGGAGFAAFGGVAGEGGIAAVLRRFAWLLVVVEGVLWFAYIAAHTG